MNTGQFFKHRYIHALANSATAEGIQLRSRSGRARNLFAELSALQVSLLQICEMLTKNYQIC